MFLQMSHGELLKTGSTFQTRHPMFGNAFLPVDWYWWRLWCDTCNAPMRAQLRVRGLDQTEQSLKASVDPGEPEVHEVVETVLTPPHPDPFEALLDEPFTGTFNHPRSQRQSQFLVP